ncbi:MAG: 16S rRNA (cytosine(967)-C(5))-methyltransferase RsmB [Defluviitaleaceae bacterium]|nr:16S rRNA (cytosine(967)-C(5))-methyltransferase RsmB [Defluviitaleaceae bacterium]
MKKSDRHYAVTILGEVLGDGAYANIALRKALSGTDASAQSRAFITELVNETLRNLILIDGIIDEFSTTPASEIKPIIKNILRISVCQIRFLERIPERAAVNEAVVLAKNYNFMHLTGFVNGILRSIARETHRPKIAQKDLALRFSYPPWLVNSLVKWLGAKAAIEFCEASHKPANGVSILVSPGRAEECVKSLEAEGVEVVPLEAESLKSVFLLRKTGDISRLSAFRDGHFIVIDPGALAAVNALGAKPGQTILDLCAAPGGKSFASAFAMGNEGRVLAFDIHPHKIDLLRNTKKRLNLSIIEPKVQDALIFAPELANIADAVLLDAPCSGLGTIRKHPEIKYTRHPDDIATLARKQLQMLTNAARYVKPGGTLVYCTCTVTREENADIIEKFLSANANFTPESATQTLPSENSDGFFTSVLRSTM